MSMLNLLRELLVEDLSLTKTNIYNQDCLEAFKTIVAKNRIELGTFDINKNRQVELW